MKGALCGLAVLVVEDEFLVADLLADALDEAGATLAGMAGTLAEALRLAETAPIDLAVLDWNLGGERSAPVARLLSRRKVPFVISTGYGTLDEEFAAVPTLTKPYEPVQLIGALATLAGRTRPTP